MINDTQRKLKKTLQTLIYNHHLLFYVWLTLSFLLREILQSGGKEVFKENFTFKLKN